MDTARSPSHSARLLGIATIAFAVAFNVPFATLSSIFAYPDVLRRPAGEILALFDAGGTRLILVWHAFALMALLFVPLTLALSLRRSRIVLQPGLAIGAAIVGSLAGLTQAIGLWRWVFVVPALARAYTDPAATEATRASAEATLGLINLYGGVAIGEHMGQLLTALFVLLLAMLQWREGSRVTAVLGFITAAAISAGTGEGLAIALGRSGDLFSLATIGGFLLLTLWLIFTGVGLIRERPVDRAAPRPATTR